MRHGRTFPIRPHLGTPPAVLTAATGVIVSCVIRADGWTADVVVRGFTTGATYDYGLGANNDPSTAKVVFTVVSKGFDNTGAATTLTRTVYGVGTTRQPYPTQTTKDETSTGGNLSFRMTLSDYIYQKDNNNVGSGDSGTRVTVTIASAFVTNSGGASQTSAAVSGLVCMNNSTVAYPKVIGHFAVEQRRSLNASADVEAFVVHKYGRTGKPVAYIAFTATGGSSSHVESGSATAMTLSARGDLLPVYKSTLALTTGAGFTRGELVTINFKAYPWIGDSAATLDSNADAGDKIFKLNDLSWTIMSTMIARVSATGNDGTGVASATQATADASPFATINGALTGIMAANNSAYSLNRCDGGEVQLNAGNYTWAGGTGTVTNGYFTLTPHSSTNRAGVVFNQTSANYQRAYQRFYNVTFSRAGNGYQIFAANTNYLVMESVNFSDTATSWYSGDTNTSIDFLDCTYNNGYFCIGGNDGHYRLHRNCTYTATTETGTSATAAGSSSCILGFKSTSSGSQGLWKPITSSGTSNYVIAYSKMLAETSTECVYNGNETGIAVVNSAFVMNLFERTGASAAPIVELSGLSMNNLLFMHNTFAGQRFNHENDIVTPSNKTFVDYVGIFNSFKARGNHRSDVHESLATQIGTWSVDNSVGWRSNQNEDTTGVGDQDFWGLLSNSTGAAAGYTSDRSRFGTDAGNGDYTPAGGSALLNRIPSGMSILPYDLFGTAIPDDGTGEIGSVQVVAVGTTYDRAFFENFGCSDTITRRADYLRAMSDSVGITESFSRQAE